MVGRASEHGRASRNPRATIDARIATVASHQHGVISRAQLLGDVGLQPGAIQRRVATGRLVAVHRAVYRLPGPGPPLSWAMAAALAGGDDAVLSGHSAAAVHGIGARGPRVEITAPRGHSHATIDCRVARLAPDDTTVHLGVPVTTVARTVFDIAGLADCYDARLAQLVNRARIVRPSLRRDLDQLAARVRGPGRSRLAEIRLRPYLADTNGPVRSIFEHEFREALARSDLPSAQFNVSVGGMEVDVLWPGAALVVELDGHAYHADAAAFERDRERDARLGALGHQVVRITWRRWRNRPDLELRRLRSIIDARAGVRT